MAVCSGPQQSGAGRSSEEEEGSWSSFPLRFGGVRKSLSTAGPLARQLSERLGRYCHPADGVVSAPDVFLNTEQEQAEPPEATR